MPSYSIHDKVFDAALNKVVTDATGQVARITTSNLSTILVNSIPTSAGLDASNFTGPASYGSGGRQLTCMVSDSDMTSISVSSAGKAQRLVIRGKSSASTYNYVVASISPTVSLGASDKVNISSFLLILADPT